MDKAKFTIGQVIHHRLFNYRGLIFDIDFQFLGSEEWYQKIARSSPPKDKPWYRVLVDNATYQTYVAEQNLETSKLSGPIFNPEVEIYFSALENGVYVPLFRKN